MKNLPTVRGLQEEYVALLAEKKRQYADYRRVRDDMRQLLKAKANVEMLLGVEKQAEEQRQDTPGKQR